MTDITSWNLETEVQEAQNISCFQIWVILEEATLSECVQLLISIFILCSWSAMYVAAANFTSLKHSWWKMIQKDGP